MKLPKNLGILLAGIWFILWGIVNQDLFSLQGGIHMPWNTILAVLAIAAGVLLLLGR